jgi:ribA/ribD-fused uncharacterized protein
MMAGKARLFGDVETEAKIMKTTDPRTIKKLGRAVKNFDEKKWNEHKYKIVLAGNIFKFSQNPELKKWLLDTGNKTIVEASPYDKIWGIGYGAKNAMDNMDKWGLNLLGKAVQEVRDLLLQVHK